MRNNEMREAPKGWSFLGALPFGGGKKGGGNARKSWEFYSR